MLEGLDWFGKEACVVVAVSAAQAVLAFYQRSNSSAASLLRGAIDVTIDWLRRPGREQAIECHRLVARYESRPTATALWMLTLPMLTYVDDPYLMRNSPGNIGIVSGFVLRTATILDHLTIQNAIERGVLAWVMGHPDY